MYSGKKRISEAEQAAVPTHLSFEISLEANSCDSSGAKSTIPCLTPHFATDSDSTTIKV